jgi:hypothetical protein
MIDTALHVIVRHGRPALFIQIEESSARIPLRFLPKLTAQVRLHLGDGACAIHDNH